MTSDLVVIGGGVVGLAAALRAATVGASVVLFDRHHVGRATDAGAGIVGSAFNTRDRGPLVELMGAAARAYPTLIDQVSTDSAGAGGDTDTGYDRVGLLAVAVSEAERENFEQFVERVSTRVEAGGHPTGHELLPLTADGARGRYPVLAEVHGALLDTGAARVDGRKLAAALEGAATAAGVELRNEPVDSIAAAVAEAEAGAVLIAGGAWSPAFAAELGVEVPVEPQRGQIAHLRLHGADTAGWPMLSPLTDQYQVTWPDGRIAVGATRETGSGYAPRTTVAGVRAVLDEAVRVAPGLAEAELVEVRVGLRPITPDLMPVIDRLEAGGTLGRDVVVATGHGPTGLTTGAFTGGLAADLALGREPEHDLSPFALDRSFV